MRVRVPLPAPLRNVMRFLDCYEAMEWWFDDLEECQRKELRKQYPNIDESLYDLTQAFISEKAKAHAPFH